MSISVTLSFANEQELVAFFSGKKAVLTAPAEAPKAAPAKASASAAGEAPKPTPVVEPSAPAAPAASTASSKEPVGVDRTQVSVAIVKLASRDKAKVIAILGNFGVKAGKELKDEQLAECYAQVSEALGA